MIAGSKEDLMRDPNINAVLEAFRSGYKNCNSNIDIYEERGYVDLPMLRSIKAFIERQRDIEVAIGIIDTIFDTTNKGKFRGSPITKNIFNKSFAWQVEIFRIEWQEFASYGINVRSVR